MSWKLLKRQQKLPQHFDPNLGGEEMGYILQIRCSSSDHNASIGRFSHKRVVCHRKYFSSYQWLCWKYVPWIQLCYDLDPHTVYTVAYWPICSRGSPCPPHHSLETGVLFSLQHLGLFKCFCPIFVSVLTVNKEEIGRKFLQMLVCTDRSGVSSPMGFNQFSVQCIPSGWKHV